MQHVSLNAWGVHCVHEMFTKTGTDLSLSSILKQKIELRKIELFIKIQILHLSLQHLAWNYSHYFSKNITVIPNFAISFETLKWTYSDTLTTKQLDQTSVKSTLYANKLTLGYCPVKISSKSALNEMGISSTSWNSRAVFTVKLKWNPKTFSGTNWNYFEHETCSRDYENFLKLTSTGKQTILTIHRQYYRIP